MKKRKFVIVGCLVAALVLVLIAQSHGAQTIRAPGVTPERMDISFARTKFMNCLNASNLTLSQDDLTRLHIVSGVLNDPYCCEEEAISEERHACLEENVTTLKYMYKMLHKIRSDKRSKCYSISSSVLPILCDDLFSTTSGLSESISRDAGCVKSLISKVAVEYDVLTKCPGN